MSSQVCNLVFTPAGPEQVATGLEGWVRFDLAGLRIDGVALRRTRNGRFTLSFPARNDRAGHLHHVVRPLTAEAREQIERAVLEVLGMAEETHGQLALESRRREIQNP